MITKHFFLTLSFLAVVNSALTAQTYYQVKDIFPGSASSLSWSDPYSIPTFLGTINQKFYFLAEGNNSLAVDLWETDGTEAGTVLLHEDARWNQLFVPEKGLAFLAAEKNPDEVSIWQYDGATMTEVVSGLEYGPTEMVYFKEKLYYVAAIGPFDDCLLTPNPDPSDLSCIFELESPSTDGLFALNEDLLIGFSEVVFNMPHLFRSDGTTMGSENFYDLGGNSNSNWAPNWIKGPDGKVFFFYQPGGAGTSMGLYITDGTEGGTQYLADLWNQGNYPKISRSQIFHNGLLYAGGRDPNTNFDRELYISDGTPGGTVLLKDINPNGDSDPNYFVVYNDLVYFVAEGADGKKQLWRTDGTEAGTFAPLSSLFPGNQDFHGDFLTVYDGQLAFVGSTSALGQEVWLSDGTPTGTSPITDEASPTFNPRELFALGNNLYFTGYLSDSGRELWVYNNGQADPTLSANLLNVDCNDNGTTDAGDDYLTVTVNVSASLLSDMYTVSVDKGTISPGTANYGENTTFVLNNGSAGAGDVKIEIADTQDPTWRTALNIVDPGPCSTSDVFELDGEDYEFTTYPNPFIGTIHFQLAGMTREKDFAVQLLDVTGRQLRLVPLNAQGQASYEFHQADGGMFFYQVVRLSDHRILTTGKIIGQ